MNMALLGASIVIFTLTYILYRSPPDSQYSPWAFFPSFKRRVLEGRQAEPKINLAQDHQKLSDAQRLAEKQACSPQQKKVPSNDHTSEIQGTPQSRQPLTMRKETVATQHNANTATLAKDAALNNKPESEKEPPAVSPRAHPSPKALTPTQHMPPPPRPPPKSTHLAPPRPSPPSTLRATGTNLLPNRGPPLPNTTSTLLKPTISTRPPPIKPRQKVILTPGHSPIDWAALTKSSTTRNNLSGVPHPIRVPPSLLAHNNGRKGRPAWSSWRGRVYNVTPYLPFHPGGEGELMRGAGKDGEALFMEVHPWVNWENMLAGCLVGFLVGEGEGEMRAAGREEARMEMRGLVSELEEMD